MATPMEYDTLSVKRGVKLGSFSPEILAKCNLKQQRFLSL